LTAGINGGNLIILQVAETTKSLTEKLTGQEKSLTEKISQCQKTLTDKISVQEKSVKETTDKIGQIFHNQHHGHQNTFSFQTSWTRLKTAQSLTAPRLLSL
jgi:hypothetical protein